MLQSNLAYQQPTKHHLFKEQLKLLAAGRHGVMVEEDYGNTFPEVED